MLTVFRKEIKYVIPIAEYLRVQPLLESVLHRDKNGQQGTYTVRSQYYDSLHDADLSDNLSGVMEKRKIRLRIYSPQDKTVKLEYKCKSNTDGVKRSLLITRAEAQQIEQHQYSCLLARPEPLAQQLYVRMLRGGYRPKTIVTYLRTAYSYPASDVRVTFDTDMRGTATPYGLFAQELSGVPLLSAEVGVLEVKYNDYLPHPIKNLLRSIDALPQANSKYSQARMLFLY